MDSSRRRGVNQRSKRSIVTTRPWCVTDPSRTSARTMAIVSRSRAVGSAKGTPCSGSTCSRWLVPSPRTKRPAERWSSVAAAMAMVGAVLTNTLLMLVPRRMRVVTAAAAPSYGELVAGVALGHPRRFVAERLGKLHGLHDLRGPDAATEPHAEPGRAHRRETSMRCADVGSSKSMIVGSGGGHYTARARRVEGRD